MNKTFNLKKCIKKAFYDDGRGYMVGQSRAWMNCYKQKCDQKKRPQEAWTACMEEYQKSANKGKWMLNYSGAKDEGAKPNLSAKTPAAQEIIGKDK